MSSPTTVNPVVSTKSNNKDSKENQNTRTIPVTLDADQDVLIVDNGTLPFINKMFGAQNDIVNESAFTRMFVHDAVIAHVKQSCRVIVQRWQNAVSKASVKHPTLTREQVEAKLLVSKAMRELQQNAERAGVLLQSL